ncbi:OsmC family protein, partial [Candidatus Bathyarchaeota archaeon]|nr:OsmC family protein [Candidatus Bathyarchaeota archaeon]
RWKGETECDLIVRGERLTTVSPPPEFGGKQGYCVPEEIFAASLASCMNTIFILVAKNSQLPIQSVETTAKVKMNVEGLEKLVFTHIEFDVNIKLEKDDEHNRKKAESVLRVAERICPLRQSWGEKVPITFKLNFQ